MEHEHEEEVEEVEELTFFTKHRKTIILVAAAIVVLAGALSLASYWNALSQKVADFRYISPVADENQQLPNLENTDAEEEDELALESAKKISYTIDYDHFPGESEIRNKFITYPVHWTDFIPEEEIIVGAKTHTFAPLHHGFSVTVPLDWYIDLARDQAIERNVLYTLYSAETRKLIAQDKAWPIGDVEIRFFENIQVLDSAGTGATTLEEYLKNYQERGNIQSYEQTTIQNQKMFLVVEGKGSTFYSVLAEHNQGVLQVFFNHRADKSALTLDEQKVINSLVLLEPLDYSKILTQCPTDELIEKVIKKTKATALEIDCGYPDGQRLVLTARHDRLGDEIPYSEYTLSLGRSSGAIYSNLDIGVYPVKYGGTAQKFVVQEEGKNGVFHVRAEDPDNTRDPRNGWVARYDNTNNIYRPVEEEVISYAVYKDGRIAFKKKNYDFVIELNTSTEGTLEAGGTFIIDGYNINRKKDVPFTNPIRIPVPSGSESWEDYLPAFSFHSIDVDMTGVTVEIEGYKTIYVEFDILIPVPNGDDTGLYIGDSKVSRIAEFSTKRFTVDDYSPMGAYSYIVGYDDSVVNRNWIYGDRGAFSPDGTRTARAMSENNYQTYYIHSGAADSWFNKDENDVPWDYVDMLQFSPIEEKVIARTQKGDDWFIVEDMIPGPAWDYVYVVAYTRDGAQHAIVKKVVDGKDTWIELLNGEAVNTWDYADHMLYLPGASGVVYRARQGDNWSLVINGHKQANWDYISNIVVDGYDGTITFKARSTQGVWYAVRKSPVEDVFAK